MPSHRTVSAARLGELLGDFARTPAWSGLAEALRSLIAEGRVPQDTRLPSERDLAAVLGLSRTTVTRTYDHLREQGWAVAKVGAGTWARLPGGPRRSVDRLLTPRGSLLPAPGPHVLDLTCAASAAPPGVLSAYERAVAELPGLLTDHGYFPGGLPELTARIAEDYCVRGLPTTPDQIMVTPGALAATAVVAHAFLSPGARAVVETPVYPNAPQALVRAGARLVPHSVETRDADSLRRAVRSSHARLTHLIPDFQNPTGLLLDDADRAELAGALASSSTLTLVDESHQLLSLEQQTMPLPLAAHVEAAGGQSITVGSASKSFWGGLRLGWLRAPEALMEQLTQTRLALDLGTPVLEQLALVHLLTDPAPVLVFHRATLRTQRDALVEALHEHLPEWRFAVPGGGLALWCELPGPHAMALAQAAEPRGVVITPGPLFGPEGGYPSRVRLPWTRPVDELRMAVAGLALATADLDTAPERANGRPRRDGRSQPVVVA